MNKNYNQQIKFHFKLKKVVFNGTDTSCTISAKVRIPDYDIFPIDEIGPIKSTLIVFSEENGERFMSYKATGHTRLHEGDTYNKMLGVKIAESKATWNAYMIAAKVYWEVYRNYCKKSAVIFEDMRKAFRLADVELGHFNFLAGTDTV